MAEFVPEIFGREPAVDGWAVKAVAEDFGELTLGALARLDLREEVTAHRLLVRREKLEVSAATQVQELCEVMDGLTRRQPDFDSSSLPAVLANSYGVGTAFGQMPGIDKVAPGRPNEWQILQSIKQEPDQWLRLHEDHSKFTYTAQRRAVLQAAYAPGFGCPLLHIDVTNDQGRTASNLFVLYWGMLAARYIPY